jgi:hypothetical protein
VADAEEAVLRVRPPSAMVTTSSRTHGTVGCSNRCPYTPACATCLGAAPPGGRPIHDVRATRDDIAHRVDALLAELHNEPAGSRA